MGLIKNAINFGNGFNIGAVAPIDSRMRVESLADLTTAWTSAMPAYKGMIVTVMETSEVYVLKDAKNYTNIASWVKLGSASGAAAGAADALKQAKAYTDQLANGAVKTNTDKIAILNGNAQTEGSVVKAVADEKALREAADQTITNKIGTVADGKTVMGTINEEVSNLKGTLGEGDATTLGAINDELDAIDAKIGTVAENKTVVQMIADAETAAKAAATKLNKASDASHLTLNSVTGNSGEIIYTIGESDIASASGLTDETNRAVSAEASLQAQIGTGFTSGNTVADAIANVEQTIDELNADVTSAEGTKVRVQVVETAGKITAVTVTDVDIASATGLTAEINARTAADDAIKGRLDKIEGSGEGSISKAVADVKGELLGEVSETDSKTLAALNDRIDKVVSDAKTYSIAKATDEELGKLGTNVKEAYKLVDEDKVRVGEFIPVYKDSSLQQVALVEQELQFTYLLDDGSTSTVGVDVSKFLAESEFANGLQVIDHIVSVKRDATSEGFLTVGADGIKLSGVQSAIDTAKKAVTDRLDVIEGGETVKGSIKKALKDAKDYASGYTDTKIASLDADVTSAEGTKVRVQVVETAGKITAVTVTDVDIASATGLTAEINARTAADTALGNRLDVIEGDEQTVGSIKKAVADAKAYTDTKITEEETARTNAVNTAKSDLLGGANTDYDTLGKLEGKIKDAEAAAKAAATKIASKTTGHVTISSSQDKTTSALTYTISETDIASASALTAETKARTDADNTIIGRLDVLEAVTVTGENAITVSESDAKKSKKVSLKLGTQPAEGVAGVVLSQNADGLVAKLYWGTF